MGLISRVSSRTYRNSDMAKRVVCHVLFPEIKESRHFANLLSKYQPNTDFLPIDTFEGNANVEILLTDPACLKHANSIPPTIKWMQSTWAGVDGFLPEFKQKLNSGQLSFKLTRCAIYGKIIGEYVLAQLVNVERNMYKVHENQRDSKWCRENGVCDFETLDGRTVAILGSGQIGTEISRMLDVGFDVRTVAKLVRRPRENEPTAYTSIDDLLNEHHDVDYLINILPSTPETIGILNEERLSKLKNCIFINVGRGSAIANEDIIFALDNGHFQKAILDVFPVEPLPESDKLWTHPNVVISPHNSGMSYDKSTCKFFLNNLERFLNQQELLALVDTDQGY